MDENSKDLKEQRIEKGPIQKFADAENKLPNDDRKLQMIKGLEASRNIPEKLKNRANTNEDKIEKNVQKINSSELTKEIKSAVEGYER